MAKIISPGVKFIPGRREQEIEIRQELFDNIAPPSRPLYHPYFSSRR